MEFFSLKCQLSRMSVSNRQGTAFRYSICSDKTAISINRNVDSEAHPSFHNWHNLWLWTGHAPTLARQIGGREERLEDSGFLWQDRGFVEFLLTVFLPYLREYTRNQNSLLWPKDRLACLKDFDNQLDGTTTLKKLSSWRNTKFILEKLDCIHLDLIGFWLHHYSHDIQKKFPRIERRPCTLQWEVKFLGGIQ